MRHYDTRNPHLLPESIQEASSECIISQPHCRSLSGGWRRLWWHVRFRKAYPRHNTDCKNYPAKDIILEITALLTLLLCALKDES